MAGVPAFQQAGSYSSYPVPGAGRVNAAKEGTHTAFMVWVIVIGIVIPVALLGGLKMSGFSFVFKGRG